jgi:hypothetical protein
MDRATASPVDIPRAAVHPAEVASPSRPPTALRPPRCSRCRPRAQDLPDGRLRRKVLATAIDADLEPRGEDSIFSRRMFNTDSWRDGPPAESASSHCPTCRSGTSSRGGIPSRGRKVGHPEPPIQQTKARRVSAGERARSSLSSYFVDVSPPDNSKRSRVRLPGAGRAVRGRLTTACWATTTSPHGREFERCRGDCPRRHPQGTCSCAWARDDRHGNGQASRRGRRAAGGHDEPLHR